MRRLCDRQFRFRLKYNFPRCSKGLLRYMGWDSTIQAKFPQLVAGKICTVLLPLTCVWNVLPLPLLICCIRHVGVAYSSIYFSCYVNYGTCNYLSNVSVILWQCLFNKFSWCGSSWLCDSLWKCFSGSVVNYIEFTRHSQSELLTLPLLGCFIWSTQSWYIILFF